MPGPQDPATAVVPQQALHRVMFRRAGLYPTLACVTNPYSCALAGTSILTVSGQTITDILRNSTIQVGSDIILFLLLRNDLICPAVRMGLLPWSSA